MKLPKLQGLSLFALLLALNCIFQPYGGFIHDAQLYAFQILDKTGPCPCGLEPDLYVAFGSQDQYSIFSLLLAPLAVLISSIGLPFALVYLIAKILFIHSLIHLASKIISNSALLLLALVLFCINPNQYAAFGVFHINENFLTPRLIAIPLIIYASSAFIDNKKWRAIVFCLIASLIHAPTAVAGIMFGILWWSTGRFSMRQVVNGLAAVALIFSTIILLPSGAESIFGMIDSKWRCLLEARNPFNFISLWRWSDFLRIGISGLIFGLAWRMSNLRRLASITIIIAVLSLFLAAIADASSYALLIQVQLHRSLWLVELFTYLLGFGLVAHWLNSPKTVLAALAWGLGYLLARDLHLRLDELALLTLIFAIATLRLRGISAEPRNTTWLLASTKFSLIATPLLYLALILVWACFNVSDLLNEPWQIAYKYFLTTPASLVLLIGVTAFLARLLSNIRFAAIPIILGCQILCLTMAYLPTLDLSRYGSEVRNRKSAAFVKETLSRENDLSVTIYWPLALSSIWYELKLSAYFDVGQLAGQIFNRETAMEGFRRLLLVRPFELSAAEEDGLNPKTNWIFAELKPELPWKEPRFEDLKRLCADPVLDVAILRQNFIEVPSHNDGNVYIYRCSKFR